MAENMDKIHIRDLLVRCVIGVRDWERGIKQDVKIDVTLWADLRDACRSDRLEHTVDYTAINKRIIREIAASHFFLIERLAERVAEICLSFPRVAKVNVAVEKPGALRFARSAVVEICREKAADE